MKILTLIFFFASFVHAHPDHKMHPDFWTQGLHLNAGGGLNMTYVDSDDNYSNIGYGLNLKTDLGYYISNRWAVEWSSNVKFDRLGKYTVWDTLYTGGLRYRIQEDYFRVFLGKAPTVIYLKENGISRVQYDGPVYGLAYGKMFEKESGLIWFSEVSVTLQKFEERQEIEMDGQTPEVINRRIDRSTLVGLYFMMGVLVF